jgi:hypothetical protein
MRSLNESDNVGKALGVGVGTGVGVGGNRDSVGVGTRRVACAEASMVAWTTVARTEPSTVAWVSGESVG